MTQQQHPGDAYSGRPQTSPADPYHNEPQQSWGNPPQPAPAGPAPASKPSRVPLIAATLGTVAVLAVGFVGYTVWDGYIREDSGVAACKAMAAGKQMDGSPKDGDGDDKMTEAEYREARQIFEDSRHEKLREHGTGLVDLAWQAQGLGDGAGLALIGPLGTHVSGLQSACADQGVIVDLSAD